MLSPLDFNPFASTFDGVADNNLFFNGHHRSYSYNQTNHDSARSGSGLRLKQETAEAYIYVVDVTGIKSECMKMTLEQADGKGTMMILHHVGDDHGKGFRNIHGTRFHRLLLRSNVDAQRITACVENGILTITAPKMVRQDDPQASTYVQMTSLAARA